MQHPAPGEAEIDGQQVSTSEMTGQDQPLDHERGCVIVHRGVTPLHVSEAWAALHGYTAAEVMAMPSIEPLRHPDDRARMNGYSVERAAGRCVPNRYAYRAVHKDGGAVWVDVIVRKVVWHQEPAFHCTIIGQRDGSGRLDQLPPAARRPANVDDLHLLDVIDQLPDGYALFDAHECLIFLNQRYVDYASRGEGHIRPGDSFETMIRDLVHRGVIAEAIGQEEAWIARRLEAFRSPDNQTFDVSHRDRLLEARHIKTNDGGTLLILADVTEERAAAHAVSSYASAIDQVIDRVSIVDRHYRYVFVNDSLVRFYSKTREYFLGRHVMEVLGREQFYGSAKEKFDRCFAGESLHGHRSQIDSKGDLRDFDFNFEPFRDRSGEIVGAIVVLRDVTEAKKRHEELQLARSAIDQISERVVILDAKRRVRLVNQSHLRYHGRKAEEVIGRHFSELIGREHYRNGPEENLKRVIEKGESTRHGYWRPDLQGETRYWETAVVPYREADNSISGAIATSRDMTEYHQAERARQRFQEAIEHLDDGYALFDEHGHLVACNRFYERMHIPTTPNFCIGVSFEAILRGRVEGGEILDAIGREEEWVADRLVTFRSESHFTEFPVAGGRWLHVRNRRTADGDTLLVVSDITEGKRMEAALAESRSRFKDFTELAADWFWEQDAEGRYTYVSESMAALAGREPHELLGKDPVEVLGPDVLKDPASRDLWHELRTTGVDRAVEIEHDLKGADGRTHRVRSTLRPVRNAAEAIIGYRGAAKDITAAYRLERQLEHQANHDALTGLINRRAFERHLAWAIRRNASGRRSSVFCFIDLDQFKIVNDTAGHLAGDRLLRQVAGLLQGLIRDCDILARLGGDEFGLLLRDCSLRRAQNMAKKLLAALNDDRFFHGESVFEIGASIGIACITAAHSSVGEIMAEADLACYAAKDAGRNRVQVYQADDRELRLRRDEMSKASQIRSALDNDRFVLYAQPILPLADRDGEGSRIEVLLRMVRSNGTLIAPDSFIPAAERYGLMAEMDRWVIRQSFTMLASQPETRININLSGLSLNEASLIGFIKRLLRTLPIAPENVCFEITETAAIQSLSRTKSLIAKLKQIGCRFALDDFGSGLSSFSYLKQLPVDYLKIDGSFIRDFLSDHRSRSMVEAIHHVAKSLDLRTVAECVESEETAQMLHSIGIDFVQGFAVGRPEPLSYHPASHKVAV
ncbi:MAG: EAL domain-containing protein [Alphaproteobacteria bacterium]